MLAEAVLQCKHAALHTVGGVSLDKTGPLSIDKWSMHSQSRQTGSTVAVSTGGQKKIDMGAAVHQQAVEAVSRTISTL